MKKQIITEEMEVHKEWYVEAKKQTLKTLPDFMNKLNTEYYHDYGTICHALASAAIGAVYAMNNSDSGGITGLQANAIMWQFVREWNYSSNKTGLRIIDYDDFLYPQCEDNFNKTIKECIWKLIQKEAAIKLKEHPTAHVDVLKHWRSIVDGVIPFGYKIKDD